MTEISKSIIQKVKDELDVKEDLTSSELYDLLHKYRRTQHPDKYTDEKIKKVAEEKFKHLNTLLQELANHIELEKQQKKPSEIVPYVKDYEIVKTKQRNIWLEEEIERLELTISVNEIHLKELLKELKELLSEKVDEKTEQLIQHYKPTKRNLYSLGITFFLTFLTGVLTKIEEIAQFIFKYSPLNETILNYIIFAILLFVPIFYLKMVYEQKKIKKASELIKTPLLINEFLNFLQDKNIDKEFNEMNVYHFLYEKFIYKSKLLKFINSRIFHLYTETTIDGLKDIFIFNLLNKQLIKISQANNLDRNFQIIKEHRYSF